MSFSEAVETLNAHRHRGLAWRVENLTAVGRDSEGDVRARISWSTACLVARSLAARAERNHDKGTP